MSNVNIPLPQAGLASYETGDTYLPTELFNSAIPQPVTEDFDVAIGVSIPAFSVVGLAAGTLAIATEGAGVAAPATGVLTFSGTGTADDTVTVGPVTYTLKAAPTTVANQVKIGATAADTAVNLAAAINGDTGSGSLYGSATVPHPDVEARINAAGVVGIVAKVPGTDGNAIATTEAGTGASFGTATLTGGLAAVGVDPIGITTAPVVGGDAAKSVAIWRAGNFNPDALNWHASFNSDAKKLAAFRGAPTPTNILLRKRL